MGNWEVQGVAQAQREVVIAGGSGDGKFPIMPIWKGSTLMEMDDNKGHL